MSIASTKRRDGIGAPMPALIEREQVLALMDESFRTAATGSGQMLLLRGEAGVGRSAVLRGFLDAVDRDTDVLLGRCDPLSAPRPWGPFIDMFGRRSGDVAMTLSAAIATGDSEAVYRGLLDVLHDGRRRVCVIDDAHWADGATMDLLRFVARRIEKAPVLVVVSYRDHELGQMHPLAMLLGDVSNHSALTRISLAPLTIHAVRAIAASVPGLDAERIHALTGGNSFYLSELLAAHATEARVDALPRGVVESVWGQLARLSALGREVAEVVAVCGSAVDPQHVEGLGAGYAHGLTECLRAGLLVTDHERLRFRCELVRLATLERIPDYVRRGIHQRSVAATARAQAETRPLDLRQSGRHGFAGVHASKSLEHRAATRADPYHLTRREREILELLAVGHSDAAIANSLFISQRTVNNHVHAILSKLGAQNRTQAATFARQWSMVSTEAARDER